MFALSVLVRFRSFQNVSSSSVRIGSIPIFSSANLKQYWGVSWPFETRPLPSPHVTMLDSVARGQRVSEYVGIPKIWERWVCPLLMETWLPPRSTPLLCICYQAIFGRSKSDTMNVSSRVKNWECWGPTPCMRDVVNLLETCFSSSWVTMAKIWSLLVKC